jgi:hypothetical protein
VIDAQYLRVYVRQLRQKIETDPERPQLVLTETGISYRLRAADQGTPRFPPITIESGGVTSAAGHPKNNYRASAG